MLRYEVVDVFVAEGRAFTGNPLAIVLGGEHLSTAQMQTLAGEFHLSETAFPLDVHPGGYRLRIFTPESELPFAGHPSVGTAAALVRLGQVTPGRLRQECGAGPVELDATGGGAILSGAPPTYDGPVDAALLLAAVGLSESDLAGETGRAGCGLEFCYLPVRRGSVGAARLDLAALRKVPGAGVSVYFRDGGHVHARVLAADVGEDPATGSAALGLGVHLAAGRLVGEGETAYVVRQGAEIGRPSILRCSVTVSGGRATRSRVGGDVVAIASGEIATP